MKDLRVLLAAAATAALLASAGTVAEAAAPDTIEGAAAAIAAIADADRHKRDEKRARRAYDMVRERIMIINDVSGAVLQRVPVDVWNAFTSCGRVKTRAEALDAARAKGEDIARASWKVQAGACDENASLMQFLLGNGRVGDMKIMRSGSPHAFPVLNAAADADPDIPWTWGEHWIVPDTWAGKWLKGGDELKIWRDSLYFAGGANYVHAYARTTTREILGHMVEKGVDFIKAHCKDYKPLMKKFNRIPAAVRAEMTLKPPDVEEVCPSAQWAGDTWRSDGGRAKYVIEFDSASITKFAWTYDEEPQGQFVDCKLSGERGEIADCTKVLASGQRYAAHLVYAREAHGDRISGKEFDGTDYWPIEIFRDRP